MNLLKKPTKLKIFLNHPASYDIKKKSYYEILGIPRNATDNEIKRAFFERSRELHPDGDLFKNDDGNNNKFLMNKNHWSYRSKTQSFMELKDAYDVLRRSDKRKEYDGKLFDMESRDGYLMECGVKDSLVGGRMANSFNTGSSSSMSGIRSSGAGHFFDPNEYFKREEKNNKFFRYGITVTLVFIISNVLYVSFLQKKKVIVDEAKRRRLVGLS